MTRFLIILLITTFISPLYSFTKDYSEIKITVKDLKNYNGKLIINIFDKKNKEYFPLEPDKAFKVLKFNLNAKKTQYTIDSIPFGNYAISLHHDENSDDEVNTNWIGIPNEGLGTSNNAKGFFGPPSYKDSQFELSKHLLKLKIIIKYL